MEDHDDRLFLFLFIEQLDECIDRMQATRRKAVELLGPEAWYAEQAEKARA